MEFSTAAYFEAILILRWSHEEVSLHVQISVGVLLVPIRIDIVWYSGIDIPEYVDLTDY